MKKYLIIVGVAVVVLILAIAVAIGVMAYFNALQSFAYVAIILLALFNCLGVLLFALVGAMLLVLVLTVNNKIVPLLEQLTGMVKTVKGTTNFVSENVVNPIIKTASVAAGARGMIQTLFQRGKKEDE